MEQSDQLSFRPFNSSDDSLGPHLQLLRDNQPFGEPLKGALIEAQYQVDEQRHLLFVTDDVPYEATLRLYLINRDAEILDSLEFGGYLATGALEDLHIVDKQTIEFSFIHLKRCRLTVKDESGWEKPLALTPGVRRPGGIRKRYLMLNFV